MSWVEAWRVLNCILVVILLPVTLAVVRRSGRWAAIPRSYLLAFTCLAFSALVGTLWNLTKGVIFNPSTPLVTLGLILGLRAGYRALYPVKRGKTGESTGEKA